MRWLLLVLAAAPVHAETLVAARTLRAQTVLSAEDLGQIRDTLPGMLADPSEAIGQEARITLYAGRPIRPTDIGPPAIVDRNQIVPLAYQAGPLSIVTEGRALMRGGVGDTIRVMNLASRSTISGRIMADGTVTVAP